MEYRHESAAAKIRRWIWDLFVFGIKEARACIFAGSFFVLLFVSHHVQIPGLARYDFLFVAALAIQVLMVALRLETLKEAGFVSLFHIVGFVLELFKTSADVGSWFYPEAGVLKIGTVPLYAGFMYAAVGSYILQSWSLLKLRFEPFPPRLWGWLLCALIYLNFFTNHWIVDLRWFLIAGVVLVYGRTWVKFTPTTREYRMPLVVAFVLIAFFIWLAENISTLFGAWQYPDQSERWNWVSLQKISSWGLLVIISFLIVALGKQGMKASQARGGKAAAADSGNAGSEAGTDEPPEGAGDRARE